MAGWRVGAVMDTKMWWRSKVLWFNIAVLIGTFLVDPSNELSKLGLPPETATRVVTIGNMLLRLTSTAQLIFQRGGGA